MPNIFRTPGDDQLIGMPYPDLMRGFEGTDLLFGTAANDVLAAVVET